MESVFIKMINSTPCGNLKNFARYYHSTGGIYGFRPRKKEAPITTSKEKSRNRIINSSLYQLATAFRDHGHKIALLDPIRKTEAEDIPLLDPLRYGLNADSLDTVSLDGIIFSNQHETTVAEAIRMLKKMYCGHIGVEFQYLCEEEREWFVEEFETMQNNMNFTNHQRKDFAKELIISQVLDRFLATKFSNVKRYGGEGAESMMVFFQTIFKSSCQVGVSDIVIGIPHRGRLNLLSGMMKFPPVIMFQKMKGLPEFPENVSATGDVLSHLRNSTDLEYDGKSVLVTMLPNPSHLEAVSPVVVGRARGLLQSCGLGDYSNEDNSSSAVKVLPIQVHGDASFSGQGVIMETVAMSCVPHFRVGGSLHLIVNNQIGFTTPHNRGRSSTYCSDVMKMISAPVIHVNGNFPEDVVKAAQLALNYRQTFQKDILVDLVCFRRWGHNEMDDPMYTNPSMYNIINTHKSVPDLYSESLIKEGVLNTEERDEIVNNYTAVLNKNLKEVDTYIPKDEELGIQGKSYFQTKSMLSTWDTGIPCDLMRFIGAKSVEIPDTISVHPNLVKHFINERLKKLKAGLSLDWATAETLAFGSLLYQGHNVRISGQDVGRGTFSHRHAMLIDQLNDEIYVPLNHIFEGQTAFLEVANSTLSEEAVLGFEYGFSVENPNNLAIWEAQFGDFFNAAQVVFDTCISSGETKWLLQSGIVILLPHGYDGAGPEHSSCRLERFLQMSDSREDMIDGDDVNWSISNPSTPAQYFHLLRKQILCNYRRPLIIVAPKTLLRHPQAVSSIADMLPGTHFSPLIGDSAINAADVKKIIFCSGKHFYLLHKERELQNKTDTAIIRLEELCPFPATNLSQELKKYKNVKSFTWSQEEHQNMGAWNFVKTRFENLLGCKLRYAGRKPLAAPAVGVGKVHQQEIQDIMNKTFEETI